MLVEIEGFSATHNTTGWLIEYGFNQKLESTWY